MIKLRLATVNTSAAVISPAAGSRASMEMVASIPARSCTGAASSSIEATDSVPRSRIQTAKKGAVTGLNKSFARLTRGAISFSSPSHFPMISNSMRVKPVILPPDHWRAPR